MSMERKPVLLFGGGLDSAAYLILMQHQGIELDCMWIDYGQKSAACERRAVRHFTHKYGIELIEQTNIQIIKYNIQKCQLFSGDLADDPFVNCRNLSMIMQALEYSDTVILGLASLGYQAHPDSDAEFLASINALFCRMFDRQIQIIAPYVDTPRIELFAKAYSLDKELFSHSGTCWIGSPDGNECGVCKKCLIKKQQWQTVKEMNHERTG
ncbi:MAG: 7-cyano-7-deazaguanine synthase [Oligoflexales bacterium]|nr:7-cyano-7-deazaguanine synthase [Oligoflexales bacterium]